MSAAWDYPFGMFSLIHPIIQILPAQEVVDQVDALLDNILAFMSDEERTQLVRPVVDV
jgi:hypothetical protein